MRVGNYEFPLNVRSGDEMGRLAEDFEAMRAAQRSEITIDVCSNCHPAYIGTERRTQSGSRIERFERRRAAARR